MHGPRSSPSPARGILGALVLSYLHLNYLGNGECLDYATPRRKKRALRGGRPEKVDDECADNLADRPSVSCCLPRIHLSP
ncbi:hypothetical protein K438DRAFT_1883073 [Mycena galopus ATCC 62051]|nr:hypothetical protein K438DRAFT_1883073 [Mycena galopus ATCC 62051]